MQRKRVLFICIGNAVRSQFAEAFARTYGQDVIEPLSAGLHPATSLAHHTVGVLAEKKISVGDQYPKSMEEALRNAGQAPVDIIVNLSGEKLPRMLAPVILDWKVADPMGQKLEVFRAAASQIESLVMRLILDLRAGRVGSPDASGG